MKNIEPKEHSKEVLKELREMLIVYFPNKEDVINQIPDGMLAKILKNDFDGNFELMKALFYNREIPQKDIDEANKKIANESETVDALSSAIRDKEKVLVLCDTDTDGSSAMAIMALMFGKFKNIEATYPTKTESGERGLTLGFVDKWVKYSNLSREDKFTIMTADNGANSKKAVEEIKEAYPNARIIITDHHNLSKEDGVEHNPNRNIYHVNPTIGEEGNDGYNLSGAFVLGRVMLSLAKKTSVKLSKEEIEDIETIMRFANAADLVNSHPLNYEADRRKYKKMMSMLQLLNMSNSLVAIVELSEEEIKDVLNKIKENNLLLNIKKIKEINDKTARVMVALSNRALTLPAQNLKGSSPKEDIHYMYKSLDFKEEDIDKNYISKLRPIIIALQAMESPTEYHAELLSLSLDIMKEIKKVETDIINEMRNKNLVKVIGEKEGSRAKIVIANEGMEDVFKIFPRKLINKAFNRSNPGFLLTLDRRVKGEVSGSFRSKINFSEILNSENIKEFQKEYNVSISTKGHERAAGFFITSNENKNISEEILSNLVKEISKAIKNIELTRDAIESIEVPIEEVKFFSELFRSLRAGLPISLDLKNMGIKDSETGITKPVGSVVNSEFGYTSIKLYDGTTLIITNQDLNQALSRNKKVVFNYMGGNNFISSGIAKNDSPKIKVIPKDEKIIEFMKSMGEPESNGLYRKEILLNDKTIEGENNKVMAKVLNDMDSSGTKYAIVTLDVEAAGLGAAIITNIGLNAITQETDLVIEEKSQVFKTINDNYVFIDKNPSKEEDAALKDLREISLEEYKDLSVSERSKLLTRESDGALFVIKEGKTINEGNVLKEGNNFVIKKLISESSAYFIGDKNTPIAFEDKVLSGISNKVLDEFGVSMEEADTMICNQLKELEDRGIKPIIKAHNLPYDLNIIKSNLPNTYRVVKDLPHLDSARITKEDREIYSSATYQLKVGGKRNAFFHNGKNIGSMEKFLTDKKEGQEFPDVLDLYSLKWIDGELNLIELKTGVITKIPKSDSLEDFLTPSSLPKNLIKYSVNERLINDKAKEIATYDIKDAIELVNFPKEAPSELQTLQKTIDELFISSLKIARSNNVSFFAVVNKKIQSINKSELPLIAENREVISNMAKDFLSKNSKLEDSIEDSWALKKVLREYQKIIEDEKLKERIIEEISRKTNLLKEDVEFSVKRIEGYLRSKNMRKIPNFEEHVNVPMPKEITENTLLGDTVVEASIGVKSVKGVVKHSIKTMMAQNIFPERVYFDTLTFRQLRGRTDEYISNIVKEVKKEEPSTIYLKLNQGILPVGTQIRLDFNNPKESLKIIKDEDFLEGLNIAFRLKKLKNSAKVMEDFENIEKLKEFYSDKLRKVEEIIEDNAKISLDSEEASSKKALKLATELLLNIVGVGKEPTKPRGELLIKGDSWDGIKKAIERAVQVSSLNGALVDADMIIDATKKYISIGRPDATTLEEALAGFKNKFREINYTPEEMVILTSDLGKVLRTVENLDDNVVFGKIKENPNSRIKYNN